MIKHKLCNALWMRSMEFIHTGYSGGAFQDEIKIYYYRIQKIVF